MWNVGKEIAVLKNKINGVRHRFLSRRRLGIVLSCAVRAVREVRVILRTIACPKCGQQLKLDREVGAHPLRCSRCKAVFRLQESPPHACPVCRAFLPADAVLCTRCGTDQRTGRQVQTPVAAEPSADGEAGTEAGPSAAWRLLQGVGDWLPGVFSPWVLLISLLTGVLGLVVMGIGVLMFSMLGTVFSAAMVGGLGLILWWHAVGFLMAGRLTSLIEALSELSGSKWYLCLALAFAPVLAFLTLIKFLPSD